MPDTTAEVPSVDEAPKLNLSCRYCEGVLTLDYEYQGSGYSSEYVPVAIECDNIKCSASWDIKGTLLELPSWIKYPELYSKPEN